MHHFVKESRIAAAPGVVFAFHEGPGALEKLTPPWEKVTVVESPGTLTPGTRAVLRTKVGPFAMEWVAEHTEYEPGRMFADRQVRGPFAYWYHRHWFLDDGRGGTLLRDEVDYRPPLGMIGEFLGARFLDSKLKKMFDYRHEATNTTALSCSPTASGDFGQLDS
jgi:ligand-binding SRPBCC domain-containing protein